MANASGFSDAVRLSQSTPQLSVGCHVVLVDGTPVLGATEISSLVTRANGGSFRYGLTAFALRALRHQLDPEEIEAEATAQIRKLCAAGIRSRISTRTSTRTSSLASWNPWCV